jgi:hypothetical protein
VVTHAEPRSAESCGLSCGGTPSRRTDWTPGGSVFWRVDEPEKNWKFSAADIAESIVGETDRYPAPVLLLTEATVATAEVW